MSRSPVADSPKEATHWVMAWAAPPRASVTLSMKAAVMIRRIMPVVLADWRKQMSITCQFSWPSRQMKPMATTTASAADSVGVAMPA